MGGYFCEGLQRSGKQVAVFFNGGVWWPCGTPVDDVAEVVEDVYAAAMAGDCQRVVQGGSFGYPEWDPIVSLRRVRDM